MTSPSRVSQREVFESKPVSERNSTHTPEAALRLDAQWLAAIERSAVRPCKPTKVSQAPVLADPDAQRPTPPPAAVTAPAHVVRRAFDRIPPLPTEAGASETLFRGEFMRTVLREKRRADRLKSPLSVVVFHFDGDIRASDREADRLLACLTSVKRATDCVARLADGAVAILLLDTDAAGLYCFLGKILPSREASGFGCDAATYPDPLFDEYIARHSRLGRRTPAAGDTASVRNHGYPLKRWLDIVGAVIALALLSPIMLITALAIRLSSPGPVIFRQSRVGKGGVPFVFYKFRSMRIDVDDSIHRDFVADLIRVG